MIITPDEIKAMPVSELIDPLKKNDRFGFLKPSESNWDTHLPLIWMGLNLSEGLVIEMGSGYSSTFLIRDYCNDNCRGFLSFDSNPEWVAKTGSIFVHDWDQYTEWQKSCGLLFIDHAPGEHRWKAIAAMADKADIIVFHDSEIGGAGNYQYDKIYPLFKYQLHYNRHGGGAGCSMVSNKIDVSVYKGLSLGQFKFDND